VETKKPMNKWLLYFIFIIKFLFGLGLIVWTVYQTSQSDTGSDDDNAFLSQYHEIDANYNQLVLANIKINNDYKITFKLNDTIIDGISHEDVFLSQRVISKRTNRKNILKVGTNNFGVEVLDQDGKKVNNVQIEMLITMATNHKYDKKLDFKNKNNISFELPNAGYWNITGFVKISNDEGRFFIKTNAR
jgi:hypothetical protein